MTRLFKMICASLVLLMTVTAAAQNSQPSAQTANRPAPPPPVSLKMSLVMSRSQGDKKISSIPYAVWVTANDQRTSLRMGTQIPVPTSVTGKEGEKSQSYSYRDVGTNIDCSASSLPDGAYKVTINIQDSSVYYPDQSEPAARSITASTGAPAFRSFNSTFTLILRDGQTAQATSATDPISGQVLKLDATLNVQK